MSNRIYDSSQLIKRRGEQATAGSFLSRMMAPNNLQGSPPILGIKDSSIMNAVKTGSMTEWTRYPTCYGISPGCPCPELNRSIVAGTGIAMPGAVTGITFTVGSIIVSWNEPTEGTGPFSYIVTPYLNGVAQTPVVTGALSYRFTGLQEWQPYTFTVSAMNAAGKGPVVPGAGYFIAPPESISDVMSGSGAVVAPEPSMKYIINSGLDVILGYIASANLGPTRGSRFAYIWVASVVGAWNWVRSEVRVSGIHDGWNWTMNKAVGGALNDNDSLLWLCSVVDYVTGIMIPGTPSVFNCDTAAVARVKASGDWNGWVSAWQSWYNGRAADGSVAAGSTQPTSSANWGQTIVVDSVTVNNITGFPQPSQWCRLTVQGKKQGYLTYNWDDVVSTCLTAGDETTIDSLVVPKTGAARDAEIDDVIAIAAGLTDQQKMIAEFWAGGPGTPSPPLMFIWLWKEYVRSLSSVSCPNMMFSLLDLAIHLFEGGRITWRLKKAHMEARPIQEIRRRYAGQMIASWNGTVDGAQWVPYQTANFVTPPFADFPSGHSHFSKAFALTMNKWFGSTFQKNSVFYDKLSLMSPMLASSASSLFGDFIVGVGRSEVELGIVPSTPITLSFNTWDAMADSAGMSRLYGGIHCLTAHTASQTVAVQVDTLINSVWNIQTTNISVPIAPAPEPAPAPTPESEPAPEHAPMPETAPAPIPAPTPETAPAPVEPYRIHINYVGATPSEEVNNLILTSKQILESIIVESHGLRLPGVSLDYDMIVDIDVQPLAPNILASAMPSVVNISVSPAIPVRQNVTLNSNSLNSTSLLSTVSFNGTSVVKLIPVMIHEMLHGMGIAALSTAYPTLGWDQFLDTGKVWYTGLAGDWLQSQAIAAYREIVGTQVTRIPVENSFGSGTAYSHWEEGVKEGFIKEPRVYDYGVGNVFHPALPEEIMTGIAGNTFYFTKMTAGALVDHGYKVNMNSSNIVPYPAGLIQTPSP